MSSETPNWPRSVTPGMALAASPRWMQAYAALAFLMTSSSFYVILFADLDHESVSGSRATSNPYYMLLWLSLYAATGIAFLVSLSRGLHTSVVTALPTIALIFASTLWSVAPSLTLFYSCMLTANILIGYVLSRHFAPAALLDLLGRMLCALLVASLILFVAVPDLSTTDRYGGGWLSNLQLHGVFAHKSDAGYYFAMLLLILFFAPIRSMGATARVAFIGLTVLAILLSNSATALLAALVLGGLVLLLGRAGRWQGPLMIGAAVLLVVISIALPYMDLVDLGAAASAVGRDPQLTGRGPIWRSAKEFVSYRPFLGYGYSAFFDVGPYSPAQRVWEQIAWFKTPHFHNSGLEILIALGVAGVFVYLWSLAGAFAVAWNDTIEPRVRLLAWALLMLFVTSAVFDFTLMKHNNFATAFMFYCLFSAQTRFGGQNSAPNTVREPG